MKAKKKTAATVGTVLHKVKSAGELGAWGDFVAGNEPWSALQIQKDAIEALWTKYFGRVQIFKATDPKAKETGFDADYGLLVFSDSGASQVLRDFSGAAWPSGLEEGGVIHLLATKAGHKLAAKLILSAAERAIQEKQKNIYAVVEDTDHNLQRALKAHGYESVGTLSGAFGGRGQFHLFHKKLDA